MTIWQKLLLFCLILITLTAPACATGDYSLSDSQLYRIHQIVEVKNNGGPAQNFTMQVPLFMMNQLPPFQQLVSFRSNTNALEIIPKKQECLGRYTLKNFDSGRVIHLELEYIFRNSDIKYHEMLVSKYDDIPGFLNPEPGVESDNPIITQIAIEQTRSYQFPIEKAKQLFDFVNRNMEYRVTASTSHSALQAWRRGWGTCEDYSLLYIALCRAAGIPARYVGGYLIKNQLISTFGIDMEPFGHAWVEVYLPGMGWVIADPTFKYTENGIRKTNFIFFGQISGEDRHVFFSYAQESRLECDWSYFQGHPARIETSQWFTIAKEAI